MNDQPIQTGQSRFYDIAPPGRGVPQPYGRPVIVGNRPEQADQMVQYQGMQPQYSMPAPASPMPATPGGIYAQPYEQPAPSMPPAQPYANYAQPAPTGIYAPPPAAPENYAVPAANYYPAPAAVLPPDAGQANQAAVNLAAISPTDQTYVYNDRSRLKSIIWLALLVFAVILLVDMIFDWGNINFLPHTHLTHL